MGDGDLVKVPPAASVETYRPQPPKPKTDDWALVIQPIANLAEQVAGTDFVPAALRGKPAAVTAAILFGRELDMPPMQALQQVHVIEGRPSLSAEQMRAMVLAAGHIIRVAGDGGSATATGRRRLPDGTYDEPVSVSWNIQMAAAAGLTGKKNWQKHPRQMLKARATAELCRDLFPDVTHGMDAVEEVADDQAATGPANDAAKSRVSRAKKGADSDQAPGPAPLPPVGGPGPVAAPPVAEPASSPAVVPLPGEESPASTPGEGRGKSTSSPAGDSQPCPHISNGEQCTWPAGHPGKHSFDFPKPAREEEIPDAILCGPGEPTPEDLKVVQEFGEELAAGKYADPHVSEGDGSPDDLAATATDETWAAAQEAAGGPVAENDPPMSKGAQRALFAAFGSLGIKDDLERYHTTSALLGRKIESWNDLSRREGERLFKAIETIKTRDELEELVQRAAEEWGQNGGS